MASNKTYNLGLSQWLATDAILRADFNADNQKIDSALGSIPRIVSGSYVGTGAYGPENPRTLTFTFTPLLVIIVADSDEGVVSGSVFMHSQTNSDGIGNHNNGAYGLELHLTWGTDRVTWYSTAGGDYAAQKHLNASGQLYHYFAIGL